MKAWLRHADRVLDLICMGRAGVDLYAQQEGLPMEAVQSFRKSLGGTPANVAIAMARLGGRAGIISAVSDDGLGRYVQQVLSTNGVDVQGLVTARAGALNSLALTELRPHDCAVVIYRQSAADLTLKPTDIDSAYLASSNALLVTGTALSASPSREACFHAMDLARSLGVQVIVDLDFRPYGWQSLEQASVYLRMACAMADMVIGNREEFDVVEHLHATPQRDDHRSAQQVLRGVTEVVVLKDGENGCKLFFASGEVIEQGVFEVKARKPFGSGDAFVGTLLWAMNSGHTWHDAARWGAAAAALNVSRDACAEAMATHDELLAFIASYSH